jgi:hypothetical protein
METEWVPFISQVGFPIVVAMYSLIRLEKIVAQNTKVMQAIAVKLGVGKNE